ncbi:MAG: OprO/OprP family phosphate-selective porin [Vicinamibacterales bacterium]
MSVSRSFLPRVLIAGAVVFMPAASAAQAGSAPTDDPDEGVIRWRNRPSIRVGAVRIDPRLKLQLDWRDSDLESDDTFDDRMRRVGIEGEVTDHLEFEIERELNPLDARPWKDVYINWSTFRELQVRAGRFKMPFGLEQLTGSTATDFAYRTLAASTIASGRDEGVMVHGRFRWRGLAYSVGVFDDDGDNGRLRELQFTGDQVALPEIGTAIAARLTARPFRSERGPEALQGLHVGAAYTRAQVPEGLNSLRGQSILQTSTFFEPVYVNGARQRVGLEFELTSGPGSVRSEWIQSREARDGQSLQNADLSAFVSTGWYLSGTWVVTGETKAGGVIPRQPLFSGGLGAIELAVRYEQLEFESASKEGTALRNPRAEHILPNRDAVWTGGVNWWPVRWVRLTADVFHERFDDLVRTPRAGTAAFWSGLFRLQIVF